MNKKHTKWPDQVSVKKCLDAALLLCPLGACACRKSLGMLPFQRRRIRLWQANVHEHCATPAHDAAQPGRPSPAQVTRGKVVAHDRRNQRPAEDHADTRGHGNGALLGVPNVDKAAAEEGNGGDSRHAAQKPPNEDCLDVLAQGDEE